MQTLQGSRRRWQLTESVPEAAELAQAMHVPPLVGQLLWRRGVQDADAARHFLEPKLPDLHDPADLPGVSRAAQRLVAALRDKQRIVIYGDYDVDGVTATSILYHTLRTADPDADVQRYIPHRIDEGYGINVEAIGKLADGKAQVIVSVDCGITAIEPAALARQRNVDLIITDHHEPDAALPDACAVVHPRVIDPDDSTRQYPFGELSGAGVAYKLAWELARTWCGSERVSDVFRELLVDLLALAALGTVADVVPLVGENRVIAHHGLGRIKHTKFAGLNALIDASRLRGEQIDAYHVGFVLAPRLNACGRMGHAKQAVHLLTDADFDEGRRIAEFLNQQNDQRRTVERAIFDEAADRVREAGYDEDDVRAIVLDDPGWHAGVIGIVCSRLVEAFGRPTVLLNTANDEAHGSARSIDGFNLYEAFDACSEHLISFGGHAMAAGCRLAHESIDAFRSALVEYAREQISVEQLTAVLNIDAEARLADLTREAVDQVERLAPFGRDNPQPVVILRGVSIAQPPRTMGKQNNHLQLMLQQDRATMRCVAWNRGDWAERLHTGTTLDVAAHVKINRWNGRVNVELEICDWRLDEPT